MSCVRDRRPGALIRWHRSRIQRRYARSPTRGRPYKRLRARSFSLGSRAFFLAKHGVIFGRLFGVETSHSRRECDARSLVYAAMKSDSQDRMAFGANDRIPCPKCEGEMIVVRRTLNPKNRNFELQILECQSCSNHERRTIDIRGELLG